ncbi:pimeloyl-ACP methyl ester carboxylesterase [Sphingomonas zeicaulis]|uniref:alpha/beta fold hydrolase n=1 Tax=Sphingomonas zeicaulis TaxID=1632740 RepID=UPI003D1CEB24
MPNRTEPLLLIPGLLCDAELWQAQVRDLADVAAPQVPDMTLDDSIAAMATRVLTAAPPRFALAALSMGGYVAFEILRRAPERVSRLALLDTSAAPDSPARAAERRAAITSLELGRFVGVTGRMLPQLVHPDHVAGPVGQAVQAMALRVGGDAFVRQQRAILGRVDSRPDLAAITVPTLVVVGAEDVLTPVAEARIIHEGIVGSALEVVEGCGHLPPMEEPERTTAVLRAWLKG